MMIRWNGGRVMDYRKLGRTNIDVSALCLGTMTWGRQNSEAEGHEQMDYALDQGINFFDSAELYPIPPEAVTQGRTEEIIGSWFAKNKMRDKVVLATKVVGRTAMDWFREDAQGAYINKKQVIAAVDGSLQRLKTDYIDLYQIHWPDRAIQIFGQGGLRYMPMTGDGFPLDETLDIMAELVKSGKIRHFGVSNETSWGVMRYLCVAEQDPVRPRVVTVQNAYNLLNRSFEIGMAEITQREDVGLLAYSPLAQGYLTGKYQSGALPKGSRKEMFDRLERYETPGGIVALQKYIAIADKYNLDPAQMALQYVTTRPFVTSNIIGATSMDQLKVDIASQEVILSAEILEEIEEVHALHSNPCP